LPFHFVGKIIRKPMVGATYPLTWQEFGSSRSCTINFASVIRVGASRVLLKSTSASELHLDAPSAIASAALLSVEFKSAVKLTNTAVNRRDLVTRASALCVYFFSNDRLETTAEPRLLLALPIIQ
jgi:hypothetical protein